MRTRKNVKGLTIIIAAAILLEVISAVQYYYTRSLLADELEKRAETELTTKAIITKNTLNMTENSLNGHIWDLKRNLAYPDSMFGVVEWVLRSHPNLLGCGIAFIPNYYPEKGRLFEPYVYRSGEEYVRKQVAGLDHDYTNLPFFRAAIDRNAPAWTEPYFDPVTDQRVVSYCKPIHNEQQEVVAVFGLDISLDWLGDTLNYRHIYPSSYDILLTETGKMIVGPKKDKASSAEVENFISMINDSTVEKRVSNSGRSNMIDFDVDEKGDGLVFYAPFRGQPKWQMAVVCFDDEVYAKLRMMRLNIGVLMLLGLVALGLIILRFVRNNRRLQQVNVEQERISSELRIAKDIQLQMLPHQNAVSSSDVHVLGSLVSAREVGGDLFDFFLRDEKLFFCIGDVSGKGVPSAMVMAVTHSLFRSASAHENNPARIMQVINETSCQGNEANMFVTFFIGVLDLPTGRLRYCNAGHDKPILIGSSPVILDQSPNLPIGVFDDVKYVLHEHTLPAGSMLFLYTDGLTEAMNGQHKQFGLDNVLKVAAKATSPQNLLDGMTAAVGQFVEGAEQSDDLTMLVVHYTPEVEHDIINETLKLKNDVRQVGQLGSFVKEVLTKMGMDTKTIRNIQLALEEAVVNVMDYAYPAGTEGDITVEARANSKRLKFTIVDAGFPFDPTKALQADTSLSVEDRPIGGLGIFLVRQLMDSINYERMEGKNILTLRKILSKQKSDN